MDNTHNKYSYIWETLDIDFLLKMYLALHPTVTKETIAAELDITPQKVDHLLQGKEYVADEGWISVLEKYMDEISQKINLTYVANQLLSIEHTSEALKNYKRAVLGEPKLLQGGYGYPDECIRAIQQGRAAFDSYADSIGISEIDHPRVISFASCTSDKVKGHLDAIIGGALWAVNKTHM